MFLLRARHQVASAQQAGQDPLEMSKRLAATPEFAAFAGWENPERLYVNVATIDRQLRGKGAIPAYPVERAKAFNRAAALAQHLAR